MLLTILSEKVESGPLTLARGPHITDAVSHNFQGSFAIIVNLDSQQFFESGRITHVCIPNVF